MASRGDINIEDVQPKLLENWVKLGIEETIDKSGAFVKLKSKDYFENGAFPVVDQGDKFISGYVNDENLLYQGELPVIIFGDHTRNVKFIDFPFAAGADGTKILKPKSFYNPKFYHYYFKSLRVPDLGYSRHFSILKEIEFPLPSLAEQNRIVDKLDGLFTKLETIKISMANIPLLLKGFRQQVLIQAVTGKLTEEYKVSNNLDNWKKTILKNVCSRITVGFVGKTVDKYRETGIPFLRSQNVRAFKYDDKNLMYIDLDFHNQIKKSSISAGDVVIVRSGYPGTTCVIPKEIQIANCSDILVLTTKLEALNPHFVAIFMNSEIGKEIVFQGKVGMAQQHFNTKKLQETTINLPTIKEQQEIVLRVESLFAKADAIELQYKSLKASIDNLPQALLHKAFKGELSEQLDSDGDARELMEEIKKLKTNTKESIKSKNIISKTNLTKKKNFDNYKKININKFQDSTLGALLYEQFKNTEFLFEDVKIPENYSDENVREELFKLLDISENSHNGFRLIMKNINNKVYFQIKK